MRRGGFVQSILSTGAKARPAAHFRAALRTRRRGSDRAFPKRSARTPARRKWALNACDAAISLSAGRSGARSRFHGGKRTYGDPGRLPPLTARPPGWAYGLPELGETALKAVLAARRVAVPGCHASGFIALVAPLVRAGLLAPETPLSCVSLTAIPACGKKMIADYPRKGRGLRSRPRPYGLAQTHKHLPEMDENLRPSGAAGLFAGGGQFLQRHARQRAIAPRAASARARAWPTCAPYTQTCTRGPIVVYRETLRRKRLCLGGAALRPGRHVRFLRRQRGNALRCWPPTITSAKARPARRCNCST